MAGRANGLLIISNLSRDKDGAVRSALVMQRSRWRGKDLSVGSAITWYNSDGKVGRPYLQA